MKRLCKTVLLCRLLVTSTSCLYLNTGLRGPGGLWPAAEPLVHGKRLQPLSAAEGSSVIPR